MTPVTLSENVIVPWTPQLALRMVVRGVRVGERDIPRKAVLKRLVGVAHAWWSWTMALPGDLFWDVQRDLLVRVHGGVGKGRRVQVVVHEATEYPIVRRLGLDAIWDLTDPEPSPYDWHNVAPAPAFAFDEARSA